MCFERTFRTEEEARDRRRSLRDLFSREPEQVDRPVPATEPEGDPEPEPETTRERVPVATGT